MTEGNETQQIETVEMGTAEEATAALGRLLAVTEATLERRAQLEHALQSRVAIEQAKGVLAERCGMGAEEAFEVIRHAARAQRMKLHDLARSIRPGEPTPPEVEAVLSNRGRV